MNVESEDAREDAWVARGG